MKNITDPRVSEAACIASTIIAPEVIPGVLEIILDENDFYYPEHKEIFLIVFKKFIAGLGIDGATVFDELNRLGKLEEIGFDYLKCMLETVPSASNATYYAKSVRQHKQQRDILKAAGDIERLVGDGETDEQIQKIQNIANNLSGSTTKKSFSFRDSVDTVIAEQKIEKKYLKTGFCDLDWYLKGFEPGQLIILAARPSMGKSAFALQIALNIAKQDKKILFFSFEMSHKQIIQRALLNHDGYVLKNLDFKINEHCSGIDQMVAYIKGATKLSGVDFVAIDYLQLMTDKIKDNRCQEISNISRKLKLLAMSENLPILALSQLNRAVENRVNHKPNLSDLRESGSIEQDADIVCLLTREDFYRKSENPQSETDGLAEVIVSKNRSGQTGTLKLIFDDHKVTFLNKAKFI